MEWNGDKDESRCAAEPACNQLGDLDVEADEARWIVRVGFDERRAAFRIAAPAELGRRLRAPPDASRRQMAETAPMEATSARGGNSTED